MKIITIILIIFLLLQIYRVTILFFKKEQNIFKKIFEFIIFILILIVELLNMKCIDNNKFNIILLLVSIILAIYIGINIIYEILININVNICIKSKYCTKHVWFQQPFVQMNSGSEYLIDKAFSC